MPKLPDNNKQTVALIGGSFRPPNNNQWKMIQFYSEFCDHVVVLVSDPQTREHIHYYADGRVADAQTSVNILKVYAKSAETDNVGIDISPQPSPVKAIYGILAGDFKDVVGDYSGWNVIVGSFKDPENWARWERVDGFASDITLLDTKKYSYPRSYSASKVVSAIQRREKGTKLVDDADALPPFLDTDAKAEVLTMIGWNDMKDVEAGEQYAKTKEDEKEEKEDSKVEAYVQATLDGTDITITKDGEIAVIGSESSSFGEIKADVVKAFKADNTKEVLNMEDKLGNESTKWIYKQINDGKFDHLIPEDEETTEDEEVKESINENNEDKMKESADKFVVYGIVPGQTKEEALFTECKSEYECENAIDILSSVYKCTDLRFEEIKSDTMTEDRQTPTEDEFRLAMGTINRWSYQNVSAQSTSDIGDALRRIRYVIGKDKVYNKSDD